MKEAQTKLEKAQTAWLNAERDKDIHENIVQSAKENVQSAKENVQSAKEMRDFWLHQQGAPAQSSEGLLAKKLDELKDELKDELRERLGQVAKNEALLMEAFLNRYTLTPVSHYSSQLHLMDTGISVHRSTTTHGVALFSKTFSQMTLK